MILIEACVNSVESAIAAEIGGALRVELCENLYEGGTTPSAGTILLTSEKVSIAVNVLIRPRGGDFLYSDLEFEVMKKDILFCKQNRVNGVVIGILKEDGMVDVERTQELVNLASPMSVTFHRAFDLVANPFQALEDVIASGCQRILTSGLRNKIWQGQEMIADLVQRANGRIIILAGSGITSDNVEKMIKRTGVTEIHASGRSSFPSKMVYKNHDVLMGGLQEIPEFENIFTNTEKIRLIVQAANRDVNTIKE